MREEDETTRVIMSRRINPRVKKKPWKVPVRSTVAEQTDGSRVSNASIVFKRLCNEKLNFKEEMFLSSLFFLHPAHVKNISDFGSCSYLIFIVIGPVNLYFYVHDEH